MIDLKFLFIIWKSLKIFRAYSVFCLTYFTWLDSSEVLFFPPDSVITCSQSLDNSVSQIIWLVPPRCSEIPWEYTPCHHTCPSHICPHYCHIESSYSVLIIATFFPVYCHILSWILSYSTLNIVIFYLEYCHILSWIMSYSFCRCSSLIT